VSVLRTTRRRSVQCNSGKLCGLWESPIRVSPSSPGTPASKRQKGGCAGEQGKFWEFHDRLFANQKRLTVTDLRNHAWSASLTIPEFEACLDQGKMAAKVEADLAEAKSMGLTSTRRVG
jgi:hypothetical protein